MVRVGAVVAGVAAGAVMGFFIQGSELGREGDLEGLVRRVAIGAVTWGLTALCLRVLFDQAAGRVWLWSAGAVLLLGFVTVGLAIAGRVGLGFATRFAWEQALSFTGVPGAGVWLGGVLAMRGVQPTDAPR